MNFQTRSKIWIRKHPITSYICGNYLVLSFLMIFFLNIGPNQTILKFIELFATKNTDKIVITFILIILMSGVEVSLGFGLYFIWTIWNFIFLFVGRIFMTSKLSDYNIYLDLSGPSCAVFCPFQVFLFIHQPLMYFKIKKYRFTDTFLYIIGIFQYIFLFDFQNMIFDFFICIFSNIIFHFFYVLFRKMNFHPINLW